MSKISNAEVISWLKKQLDEQKKEYEAKIAELKADYERQLEDIRSHQIANIPQFITAKEAMHVLGISKTMWYQHIRPLLTGYNMGGRMPRYRLDDLEYIINKIKPTQRL